MGVNPERDHTMKKQKGAIWSFSAQVTVNARAAMLLSFKDFHVYMLHTLFLDLHLLDTDLLFSLY